MAVDELGFPLDVVGDHLASASGAFEPQRQSNWLFTVGGLNNGRNIELALESGSLPSVAVEEVPLNFLNVVRYVAGRAIYDTVNIVFKDMVDVGVASAIKEWHELVFNPATLKVGLARDYKKQAELLLFAPEGSFVRSWELRGCFPMSVNYGNLDMSSSDPVMIEAVFRYDRAIAVDF